MVRKAPPVAFNSQNIKAGALVQGSPRLRTGGSATPAQGGWGLWVVLPRPAGAGAACLGTTLGGLKGTPSTLGCSLVMRLLRTRMRTCPGEGSLPGVAPPGEGSCEVEPFGRLRF